MSQNLFEVKVLYESPSMSSKRKKKETVSTQVKISQKQSKIKDFFPECFYVQENQKLNIELESIKRKLVDTEGKLHVTMELLEKQKEESVTNRSLYNQKVRQLAAANKKLSWTQGHLRKQEDLWKKEKLDIEAKTVPTSFT